VLATAVHWARFGCGTTIIFPVVSVMSNHFNLTTSRLNQSPVPGPEDSGGAIPIIASSAFASMLAGLRAGLGSESFEPNVFLNQLADQARHYTGAESTVVALRRQGTIVCLARRGAIGPAPGAPLDSTSGLTGECVRKGAALRCDDSERDSRVNAEVCRRLGVRSFVVVPVFEGSEVAGLLEAFSVRPNAFQDQHMLILEHLASLIAESKTRVVKDPSLPAQGISPALPKSGWKSPPTDGSISSEEGRRNWARGWSARPYQIAIVVGFLLLDVLTIYWWQQR
jgi:GAF domain